MRRAAALFASSFLLVPAAWGAASCSSSSQASHPNGPVFDTGTGTDAASDNPPDARFDVFVPPKGDGGAHDGTMADAKHDGDSTVGPGPDGGTDGGATDSTTPGDATPDGTGPMDVVTTLDASACPSGTGTIALLGGTSGIAFATVSTNGKAFVSESFAGESVVARPAVIPFSGGLLSVFPTSNNDVMVSTRFTLGATPLWSAPVAIPALAGVDASATELGAPTLAIAGSNGQVVYQGSNNKFYHGVYTGGAWGAASDAVGGTVSQDYGPSAPSAAVAGTTLYVAYDGGDGGLYVDTWTSAGGWSGAYGIMGAGTSGVPPTLISLNGGAADLMLVFEVQTTNDLFSVVHTVGGTGAASWSVPVAVDATANTATAVSLAAITGGNAAMVYLGSTDSLPYFSLYTAGASTPWTTPASLYPDSLPLASPPTVAAGVCGEDAIAAMVEPAGVEVTSLKAGVWGAPVLVNGTGSMTYATIATLP